MYLVKCVMRIDVAIEVVSMSNGVINDSPLRSKVRKRRYDGLDSNYRAAACCKFAAKRAEFRSIDSFVQRKREEACDRNAWCPSKGQMVRDMRTIFGSDWASKRGGGGRGKGGGRSGAERAPGLEIPSNPELLLRPFQKPTILSKRMENDIVKTLNRFELQFGVGIITAELIKSIATEVILSSSSRIKDNIANESYWRKPENQHCINNVLTQLKSVGKNGWLRNFFISQCIID